MLNPSKVVQKFMELSFDYVPSDVDEADMSFALIELESIGDNFYNMKFNVNDPKDFIPHVWAGNFVDIGRYDDIKDETEMARFLFDEAVKYRESHLLKFLESVKRMENMVER